MSEIEKMYENANVETLSYCCDGTHGEPTKRCKGCPDYREIYPQITAEKLINLVMFLINKGDFNIKKGSVDITFESFTNCIAGLINNIWQDLSEEEKQQVKGILE